MGRHAKYKCEQVVFKKTCNSQKDVTHVAYAVHPETGIKGMMLCAKHMLIAQDQMLRSING